MKKILSIIFLSLSILCLPLISHAQNNKTIVWVKNMDKQVVSLYQLCNNQLVIEGVNAKGQKLIDLEFKARNAQILKANKKGWIELYPEKDSKEVIIIVSEGNDVIDSLILPVKKTPIPTSRVLYNGKEVDLRQGLSLNGYSSGNLKIEVMADIDFSTFFPKDARYILSEAKIILAKENRAIISQTIDYLGNVNIFDMLAQAKSGDRLVIELPRIIRIDSQDNTEKIVHDFSCIFTIPLN